MNKNELRKTTALRRRALTDKPARDRAIAEKLLSLPAFKKAKTVLCYVSLPEEVATEPILQAAWQTGKTVAVPYCRNSTGSMDFYVIRSFSDLQCGSYNIPEPVIGFCRKVTDFSDSLCIVPGLAFTKDGYRLGYGKGYYDKFLKKYAFLSVGLCYNSLILDAIPTESYDIPVELIVTEEQIFGGKYGRL